ncbi:MAG: sulfotransferase family protein [Planctomycetaceae bacterium]
MSLPNLLVVGVPKAGTSSLFAYLAQHPDVYGSPKKEIGYFTGRQDDGRRGPVEDYERFFDGRAAERYAMEATPSTCYQGPAVLRAIRETLEAPRLLLILREPVERLWSAYTFQRSLGHLGDVTSFDAYLDACEAARREHPAILEQGYRKGLSIGMYGEYVGGWCETFGPDLRVLFFDDLRADPAGVVRDVAAWLGIDPDVTATFRYETRNPTVHPRSVALAKGAALGRGLSKKVLGGAPALRRRIRDTYFRVNAGRLREALSDQTRARVAALYADSNRVAADALRAHGDTTLPPWLEAASPGQAPASPPGAGPAGAQR